MTRDSLREALIKYGCIIVSKSRLIEFGIVLYFYANQLGSPQCLVNCILARQGRSICIQCSGSHNEACTAHVQSGQILAENELCLKMTRCQCNVIKFPCSNTPSRGNLTHLRVLAIPGINIFVPRHNDVVQGGYFIALRPSDLNKIVIMKICTTPTSSPENKLIFKYLANILDLCYYDEGRGIGIMWYRCQYGLTVTECCRCNESSPGV